MLFNDFVNVLSDIKTLYVLDIYPAGEKPIEGADAEHLAAGLVSGGHRNAMAISGPEVLAEKISKIAHPDDFVIFLGAGDITKWAHALEAELKSLEGKN